MKNVFGIIIRHLVFSVVFVLCVLSLPNLAQSQTPQPGSSSLPYVAVMDFQVHEALDKTLGPVLADRVRETLMTTKKYKLIDRGNIEVIMTEIGRGQSGCFEESCAVQAGRMLSAHFIITGRVAKLSADMCQVAVQMTDVARAEIVEASTEKSACNGDALAGAAENVALDIAGMERRPGTLILTTTPPGALVTVDGRKVGESPVNAKLRPGMHYLVVVLQDYKTVEQEVTINPGEETKLNLNLINVELKRSGAISVGALAVVPESAVVGLRFQHRLYKGLWAMGQGYFSAAQLNSNNLIEGFSLPNGDLADVEAGSKVEMVGLGIIYNLPYFKRFEIGFEGGIDYYWSEITWELTSSGYTPVSSDDKGNNIQNQDVAFHGAVNFSYFFRGHFVTTFTAGYMYLTPFTFKQSVNTIAPDGSTNVELTMEDEIDFSGPMVGLSLGYYW